MIGVSNNYKLINILIALFLFSLFFPAKLWACSCCADPGDWLQETRGFEDWEVESLNKLNFGNRADLFRAIYSPDIKGIHTKLHNVYLFDLSLTRLKRDWTLLLKTLTNGDAGILHLQIPDKVVKYRVDPKDKPHNNNYHNVELYKETRFEGKITGEGIFKTGKNSDARYQLILQGRGLICETNKDYRSWILIVSGTSSVFTLHGMFGK